MHQVRRNRQTSSEIMESAMFQAAAMEIDNFLSEGNTRRADSRVRQLLMEILRTCREESGQHISKRSTIAGAFYSTSSNLCGPLATFFSVSVKSVNVCCVEEI